MRHVLYVFGNSVEDRFRPLGYALFYLMGGVVAGIGHCLMDISPAIGASGAVAAVTGAYLALFPKTQITAVAFVIFFLYPFVIPSMYLIGLFMVFDLVMHAQGVGQTAYAAHLSGYGFGFTVGMTLLATRILPRESYDLPSLIKHWNRRREFRALTAGGSAPWHVQAARGKGQSLDPEAQRLLEMRAAIRRDYEQGAIGSALDQCRQLLASDPKQVLDRDLQSVLANHAMQSERHDLAVRLYEGFSGNLPQRCRSGRIRIDAGLALPAAIWRSLSKPVRMCLRHWNA